MTEAGNSYQLQPKEDERFYPSRAKAIIEQVLSGKLKNTKYDATQSAEITENLTRLIRARVKCTYLIQKELRMPRYKLGVQVIFGELKGQGLRTASKSLWDPNFDNWAEYTFSNENIFCTGLVFAMYFQ